jgi:hypothetical protein
MRWSESWSLPLLILYTLCRLSKLPLKEHRLVSEDPRFLQLVGLAKGKLQSRPKDLQGRHLSNMMNGEVTREGETCTRGCLFAPINGFIARLLRQPLRSWSTGLRRSS